MTGSYARPTDAPVSCSWQCHKDRNPPSPEPGTDYACGYGTDLAIAGDGVVSVIDMSPGGGEGRRVSIDLDDGRRVSYIHLDRASAWVGMRVSRGQKGVIWSGASGNGGDWYYGPHVHVTLWERPGMPYADSIDFDAHVGEPEPPTPPKPKGDIVGSIIAARDMGGHVFYFEGGYVKHLADMNQVQTMQWALGDSRLNQFDDGDFQRAIWGFGLEEYSVADVLARATAPDGPGGYLVASWRDERKSATTSKRSLRAAIAALALAVLLGVALVIVLVT